MKIPKKGKLQHAACNHSKTFTSESMNLKKSTKTLLQNYIHFESFLLLLHQVLN